MRLAVWSPLPPAASGIADYVAETLPGLSERYQVTVVVPAPDAVAGDPKGRYSVCAPGEVEADLDLYHLGNSPEHTYVYRAALRRPGVAVLHEWNLHDLVLAEAVEGGETSRYLREVRREHGARGSLAGREIVRALGGRILPSVFPLNGRVLESSLAIVGLTELVASKSRAAVPDRPVLHLRHHLALPLDPLPSRAEARARLGLPEDAFVVTVPGLATAHKRLEALFAAAGRIGGSRTGLRLVVAGPEDAALPIERWAHAASVPGCLVRTGRLQMPDFIRHLAAADVVASLRFPSYGEVSGALVRALGIGRPALVTAGTPCADEFPEGTVVPVSPGAYEVAELSALLTWLAADRGRREAIGALAAAHVRLWHDLDRSVAALAAFIDRVASEKASLLTITQASRVPEEGLLGFGLDEIRWCAREIGVPVPSLAARVAELLGPSC